ncbi:MAG: indole-3-glycerol phosphate synthase TrpC [Terriglobales bacterium]
MLRDAAATGDILAEILEQERERVAQAERAVPLAGLQRRAEARQPRDFAAALRSAPPPAVIAEIKQASPSRGLLRSALDVPVIAAAYAAAGASAISVLTEGPHFRGRLEYLGQARATCPLPLLRKDFIFSDYQVWESAAHGADAVLLIVAALDDALLPRLLATAARAGLAALTEVHDEAEMLRALAAGATILGINNRDLRSLRVDKELAWRLAPRMPAEVVKVAESGLRDGEDLRRAAAAGFDAVLIGERFMQSADPGAALAALLAAARGQTVS